MGWWRIDRFFFAVVSTDGRPRRTTPYLAAGILIVGLFLPVRAQSIAEPHVMLKVWEATAEELASALTRALGTPVTVDPPWNPRVSLELEDVPAVLALDRAAAALHGRWLPVYQVGPAPAGVVEGAAGHGIVTGRSVTLRLADVAAGVALASVARAAGARLELTAPLQGTVTLEAVNLPVEAALDQVTGQIGARWRVSYQIVPGPADEPPPAAPEAAPVPSAGPVPLTTPPGPSRTRGGVPARAPDSAALRQMLTGELVRLLQTDPGARSQAVRRYADRLERLLRGLWMLPPAEQARRIGPLRPLLRGGLRAFGGLTPDQQSDFRPVIEVFRRWTR